MRAFLQAMVGALGMAVFHYWFGLPLWLTLAIIAGLAVSINGAVNSAIESGDRKKRRQIRR